ncbi:MAG: hypothetical protein M3276_08355, partial [Actinomycetota bacterium]|nr:hypothetical protein [Actinomycetota bacterium]
MTTAQLIGGLGGAMGSHYMAVTNQLYFVEIDGKVSVLDLVRSLDTVVFAGTATVPADSSLSLIDGTSVEGGEIRWDHDSPSGQLVMRPQGTCLLSYLGDVDYGYITHASLQNLSYLGDVLRGEGPDNQMVEGAVFGVFNWHPGPTDEFDYAKVQVVHSGETLKVQWEAYRLRPAYRVLGRGYAQPMDIVVASDGRRAYLTEGSGNLLLVDLANAERSAATVVTSGLTQPHQMAVDEAHAQGYVVEFNDTSSRLVRVDLVSGVQVVVASYLDNAVGVVITSDGRTAYVSQQTRGTNSICRVTLANGHRENLPVVLGAPASLAWAAGGESQIVTTDLQTNEVMVLDLAVVPIAVRSQAAVA